MDEKIEKIIKERFETLPESIQEIILSMNYEEDLIEISKKYGLNVEQMGALELQTTMVMMGITPTQDFQRELIRELNVDMVVGAQIVADINVKIFLKIRDLLKLMNTPPGEEPKVEEAKYTNQDEASVLHSAGIKIISPDLKTPELDAPAPSILEKKFSGAFQIPSSKTEYTIPGVSGVPAEKNAPPAPPPYPPKADPYREPPE